MTDTENGEPNHVDDPALDDRDDELDDLDDGDGPLDDEPVRSGRLIWAIPFVVLVIAAAVVAIVLANRSGSGSKITASGPEGVPIQQVPDLAPASTTATGSPVDGITCRTSMQQAVGYHVHIHLVIFVNGRQERIPAGAGIAAPRDEQNLSTGLFVDNGLGGCLYWLHVHANDGIIHVEAPNQTVFTLGQFFDIWQQPLGPNQVGPAQGPVVAFNGKRFAGNPRDIPLIGQQALQLDVGTPVAKFKPIKFNVIGICGGQSMNCAIGGQ